MDEIYNDNIENVYIDINKHENPKFRYQVWNLYLDKKYNIQLPDFSNILILVNDIRKKRKDGLKQKLFSMDLNSCLLCSNNIKCCLDACHIIDHSISLNDDINNVIILCKNCHTLYDIEKLFYIIKDNNDYKIIIKNFQYEEYNKFNNKIVNELKKYNNKIDKYLKLKIDNDIL
jgi:hypothetical protein